eukprot:TRINITY_DN582_c0_g1_i2.p1 TRINITY_DN582_c0_g1~~TRINITY_DN582_c0_g1_i2.p1  ORF type:complete len:173 (+),score=42.13 TRINITY_DN582_c0_g1_i2:2-520(+)
MIRRPPRSTPIKSSAASDVYKRQVYFHIMNISIACIPASVIVGFIPAIWRNKIIVQETGGFNNVAPRTMLDHPKLQNTKAGAEARRSNAAHLNSMETFPFFASAVLAAHVTRVNPILIDRLAMGYVASRFVYNIFYIKGETETLSVCRSLTYFGGYATILYLFYEAARKVRV